MKIILITTGLAHYYTKVLNKLNSVKGIEIIAICPDKRSKTIGDGVLLTDVGKNFKVIRLSETKWFKIFLSYKGLFKVISQEKPDIIITLENFLYSLVFFPSLIFVVKSNKIKLIMKSIPFRVPTYNESKEIIRKAPFIRKLPKLLLLILRKKSFCRVDAHLDYIDEAITLFGSYGVPREKIFITRNSPDTDLLFETRKRIDAEPPFLTPCPLRLIHVGRLVEWKRVDLLLAAFAHVKQKEPRAELLIIGSGPQDEELHKLSNKLKLAECVILLGDIHDPYLLGRYLRASTIYILAGMGGLSINDAMCFGLPIICSVCDGTEKVLVRDRFNGRYFKEGDYTDLAEKILEIGSNPDLIKIMGERSTEIIRSEVNIHTFIQSHLDSFNYVTRK
jgi:glycosyltransferase involved in cell wall biosynthesis